jgi:hypothetical protein
MVILCSGIRRLSIIRLTIKRIVGWILLKRITLLLALVVHPRRRDIHIAKPFEDLANVGSMGEDESSEL